MSWTVGMKIGESFAEILATNGNKEYFQRTYIPKISIPVFLNDFFNSHPDIQCSRILISSRFIEKILNRKLGGSVATITTSGFENWAWIRQPMTQTHFDLHPQRVNPITNEELIFGLTERTLANGTLEQGVLDTELEFLEAKFKLMEVKRVCINLLHSQTNPENEIKVGQYFQDKGYQIFLSHELKECLDEVPRWRRNLLNAAVAGVFEDLVEEIKKGISGFIPEDQIYFWNANGDLFNSQNVNNSISGLFGYGPCLNRYIQTQIKKPTSKLFKASHYSIVYLGIEMFSLIDPFNKKNTWSTAWGPVELKGYEVHRLAHQPTTEILTLSGGEVQFSEQDIGFEPGPMCFGKSQKVTLFDLMVYLQKFTKLQSIDEKVLSTGATRLKSAFLVMAKSSSFNNVEDFTEHLWNHFIQRLAQEIAVKESHDFIYMTGAFAHIIAPELMKILKFKKIIVVNSNLDKMSSILLGATEHEVTVA